MNTTFYKIFINVLIAISVVACVPSATEKKAACGANQSFNSVTRTCYSVTESRSRPVATLSTYTLAAETAATLNLTYLDGNKDKALSCKVSSLSSGIEIISPQLTNGGIYTLTNSMLIAAASLAAAIPVGSAAATAAVTNARASLDLAKKTYNHSTILSLFSDFENYIALVNSKATPYLSDTFIKSYSDALAQRTLDYNKAKVFVMNRCDCSGGICSAVVASKKGVSGSEGFSYTITDIDGEGSPGVVGISISSLTKTTNFLAPTMTSTYASGNESSTNIPSAISFNLASNGVPQDYFSTSHFTYSHGKTVLSGYLPSYGGTKTYVLSDSGNGKITNCLGLGGSNASDLICDYVPNNGDAFSTTIPTKATVTINGLTFLALAEGSYGNNLSIVYKDISTNIASIDGDHSTTLEKYGLASGTNDVYIRVIGNTIYVIAHDGITKNSEIKSAIEADLVASNLVSITASNSNPVSIASASSGVSLSGGVDGYDTFSYSVSNGFTSSSNTSRATIQVVSTPDYPQWYSYPSLTSPLVALDGTGISLLEGSTDLVMTVNASTTYYDPDDIASVCTVSTNPVDLVLFSSGVTSGLTGVTLDQVMKANSDFSAVMPLPTCSISGVAPNKIITFTVNRIDATKSDAFGDYALLFKVGNGSLETFNPTYQAYKFKVTPVNDAPILGTVSPQSILENSTAAPSFGSVVVTANPGGGGFENDQTLSLALSSPATFIANTPCTNYTIGSTSPLGNLTPSALGATYFDSTAKVCYKASGTTSSSWQVYPSLTAIPLCAYTANGPGVPTSTPGSAGLYYLNTANNTCYKSIGTPLSWILDNTVTSFLVAYVPVLNQSGTATISMTLSDSAGASAPVGTFDLTVTSVNDPPYFLSSITRVDSNEGGSVVAGPFTVDEDQGSSPDEDAQGLVITSVTSDNTTVLPNAAVTIFYDINDNGIEDTGEKRLIGETLEGPTVGVDELNDSKLHSFYLKLNPIAGVSGNANVTITVSDGSLTAKKTFAMVIHSISSHHKSWTNITSVGLKTDKLGAPAALADIQCNYNKSTDTKACDGNKNCLGSDSPASLVTPDEANVLFWDSANKKCYRSTGTTVFSWVEIKSACPITRIAPTTLTSDLLSNSTTISVVSTSSYPSKGTLLIGNEEIYYRNKSATTFSDLTRGLSSTTAEAHFLGERVRLKGSDENLIYDSTLSTNLPIPSFNDQYYYNANTGSCYKTTYTNLKNKISATDTIIPVTSSKDFSASGDLMIGSEVLSYSAQSVALTDFDPATRDNGQIHNVGEAVWGWSATSYSPTKVTLSWNPFTVTGIGADSGVSIIGWNVYRRESGHDYDYLRGFLKTNSTDVMTLSDPSIRTYVDKTAEAGKVYYYLIRPVESSIRHLTISTPEIYSEVRVFAALENYAFVHRWMVNQEICNSMHMTTSTSNIVDPTKNYRCPYKGPGESRTSPGYYDIEKDMLVDISESGCPYTASPTCSVNGCIGIGNPDTVISAPVNSIYYDRSTGACYIKGAAANSWSSYNAVNFGTASAAIKAAMVDKTSSALNAPLSNITQDQAKNICSTRSVSTPGLSVTSLSAALPSKKEFMAYSASPFALSDSLITDLEQGFSLNVSSRCNSSQSNGIESAFSDSPIPNTSDIFSLPGTQASGIRSLYTGSVPWGINFSTESCSSRYGVQDIYGNVAEWVSDKMICNGSAPGVLTTTLTLAAAIGDTTLTVGSTNAYSASGKITIGNETLDYTAITATTLSLSTATVSAHSIGETVTLVPSSTNYICSSIKGTDFGDYDFANGVYNDTATYRYKFDLVTGPYNDQDSTASTSSGDAFLTSWDFRDELYNAGKFSFPIGMPINVDIANTLSSSPVLNYLLDIGPTSGITTNQLHEDGIIVNAAAVRNTLSPSNSANPNGYLNNITQAGAFAQGGSYLSSNKAGRFTSELIPDSTVGPDVGFRCYVPIQKTHYNSDSNHTYPY